MYKLLILPLLIGSGVIYAQHHETNDSGSPTPERVNTIKEWFQNGHTRGMFRSHMMGTFNYDSLSDHAAVAVGGRLYFHTAYFKGFKLGIGGLYTYNMASSDLSMEDPSTRRLARWERELFDITDPDNKSDLDRLEELFIKYKYKNLDITLGKQAINTPLVNEQDYRMKPTALHGIWSAWKKDSLLQLHAGWFNKASPQSTTEWYDMGEAISVYETGVNPDGSPSQYKDHLETDGLLVLGGKVNLLEHLAFQLWQYEILDIMRATFTQVDFRHDQLHVGVQAVNAFQAGNGGHEEYDNKYFHASDSHIISGRIAYEFPKIAISLNSALGFGEGRFLFPRELGTAQLFTYLARHRVEGLGNYNTQLIKFDIYPLKDKEQLNFGVYLARTDTDEDPRYNKYGFLTYNQVNLEVHYNFKHHLEGLELELLAVGMKTPDQLIVEPDHVFNKTNLIHLNFIANYHF